MRITMNEGEELEGDAASAVLLKLKDALIEARATNDIVDYHEPGMSKREDELEWLYEHAPCEVTDEVLDFLYADS